MEVWVAILPGETDPGVENLYNQGLARVDPASRAKIAKFYRRADAWRCLLGRLLPRQLLKQRNVACDAIRFDATSAGKPFILHPILDPPIAYNIAHDDSLVAIAFQLNACDSLDVGVDVMRVALPKGLSLAGFIDILSDQLSPLELKNLHRTDINPEEASTATLQTLFWLWTVKEAYTKTLGLGLGFNFSRITFDARSDAIYVDDAPLCGFEFVLFGLDLDSSEGVGAGAGRYQGVAVRRIESGSDDVGAENVPSTIVRRSVMFKKQQQQRQQQQDEDWIKFWSAADLVERCDILAT